MLQAECGAAGCCFIGSHRLPIFFFFFFCLFPLRQRSGEDWVWPPIDHKEPVLAYDGKASREAASGDRKKRNAGTVYILRSSSDVRVNIPGNVPV